MTTKALLPIEVEIRNFQSIESLDFTIKGFTCITGKSNIGKSAIMRALSRAINNDPVVGLVRKGSKFCSVLLKSDNYGFKWEKGERDVNRYTINEKIFDKTGQNQLPEIEAMGFKTINIGDNEVQPWFASQFAPIFLLDRSGPQVTNFISNICNLNILQNSILICSRGKSKCNEEAKFKAAELLKVNDKIARVSGLEVLSDVFNDLTKQFDSIIDYDKRIDEMSRYDDTISLRNNQVDALRNIRLVNENIEMFESVEHFNKLIKMNELKNKLDEIATNARKVVGVKNVKTVEMPTSYVEDLNKMSKYIRIYDLSSLVDSISGVSSMANGINTSDVSSDLESISKMHKYHDRFINRMNSLMAVSGIKQSNDVQIPEFNINNMTEFSSKIDNIKLEIEKLELEIKSFDDLIRQTTYEISLIPTCATCGRPHAAHEHED